MPLFFIIAIGLGAATVGATAVDVTTDWREQHRSSAHAQVVQTQAIQAPAFQASAYATAEDCLNAAALQGVALSACQR